LLWRDRVVNLLPKHDRGWPCKTSIPGSNPGGASKISQAFQRFRPSCNPWTVAT
jgi:hypothetical protein